MIDVLKVLRLLKDDSCHIEIEARDRGNVAYVVSTAQFDANGIDVNLECNRSAEALAQKAICSSRRHIAAEDNSISDQIIFEVARYVPDSTADADFLDPRHVLLPFFE